MIVPTFDVRVKPLGAELVFIMKEINYGRFISVYQSQDGGYVLQQYRIFKYYIHKYEHTVERYVLVLILQHLGKCYSITDKKMKCIELEWNMGESQW